MTGHKLTPALITVGALALAIGAAVAVWAWNLPFGRDPYTTYLDSEPGRTEHAIRLAVRGVVVAGLGFLILAAGITVRRVGHGRAAGRRPGG